MSKAELELANCPKHTLDDDPQTEPAAPRDEDHYPHLTCAEVRRHLLQLIRKTTQLKRKQTGLLSELTSAERTELQEALDDTKKVRDTLRKRCSEESEPLKGGRRRR
jgi:hypothetical protein